MNGVIPIFPLAIVVFPNSRYPLHIFEERYKKMVKLCIKENTGFGVLAKIGDEMSNIGSYVYVKEIIKQYETGEFDIVVEADDRFKVLSLRMHPDGYYEAEIEGFADVEQAADQNLVAELKEKFESIISRTDFKLEKGFWNNYNNTNTKSFKIAEKSGLKLTQQQEILTLQSENERLTYLIDHIESLERLISNSIALKNLVIGDGYIN